MSCATPFPSVRAVPHLSSGAKSAPWGWTVRSHCPKTRCFFPQTRLQSAIIGISYQSRVYKPSFRLVGARALLPLHLCLCERDVYHRPNLTYTSSSYCLFVEPGGFNTRKSNAARHIPTRRVSEGNTATNIHPGHTSPEIIRERPPTIQAQTAVKLSRCFPSLTRRVGTPGRRNIKS